jgi:hypothetical protein
MPRENDHSHKESGRRPAYRQGQKLFGWQKVFLDPWKERGSWRSLTPQGRNYLGKKRDPEKTFFRIPWDG